MFGARSGKYIRVTRISPFLRKPQGLLLAGILCGLPGVLYSQTGNTAGRGVTVEEVGRGSAGDRAGIRADDILIAWVRGSAKGNIESPWDLSIIEREQAPRGEVSLRGTRGGRGRVWKIGQRSWEITARPPLSDSLLTAHLQAKREADAKEWKAAAEQWRTAAAAAQASDTPLLASWLLYKAGEAFAKALSWAEADDTDKRALDQAAGADPAIRAQILLSWSKIFAFRAGWR